MVPILWFSLRRGPKLGLVAGVIYGLVQLALGPYIFHPLQVLLDYPIAFGLLGIAGFFKKYPIIGVSFGILARFLAHFISGVVFFAIFTPEGMHPAIYSAIYNGSYLIIELIISVYIIFLLRKSQFLQIYM
jgi:thiamine transporter